jgi:hypothetical protein
VLLALASCLMLVVVGIAHLPDVSASLARHTGWLAWWYLEGMAQGAFELLAGLGLGVAIYRLGLRHGAAQHSGQGLPQLPTKARASAALESSPMPRRAA